MNAITISFVICAALFACCVAESVHRFKQQQQKQQQQQPQQQQHQEQHGFRTLSSGTMSVGINTQTGEYSLSVDGLQWLLGAPVFITVDGRQYNSAPGGGLIFSGAAGESGIDVFGSWTSTLLYYSMGSVQLTAGFRVYDNNPDVIVFIQNFMTGVNGTSTGNKNAVCTSFPSFYVANAKRLIDLGYLSYGGIMFGDMAKAVGVFNASGVQKIKSGLDSGPLVLFDTTGNSIVMSPLTNFMATLLSLHDGNGQPTVSWGVLGGAKMIPVGFNTMTIASYSPDGINKGMRKWGSLLRLRHDKGTAHRDSDFTNHYLGYWTDNGAYYYYNTEPGLDYEKTLVNVVGYANAMNIPYRYLQFDSWFYPKDSTGGATEWNANMTIFPHGMSYVWNQTGLMAAAHSRWWSPDTVYARQNGGLYDFVIERQNNKSLPLEQRFWNDLLRDSRKWGLMLYEQDWLNEVADNMDVTTTDVSTGHQWLLQMGKGANENGLNIQYCMAPSRVALTSLHIPNIANGRVSDDYQPGNDQWKIGISSMFADALGVAPFKDNFWTTTNQPGNPYNKSEPYPELQSVVATLSAGPVGIGDRVDHSDVQLIMRSCNAEGLLLKPLKPATAVDTQLYYKAFNNFQGEVWTTYSNISGWIFGIIFAADFSTSDKFALGPTDAGFGDNFPASFVYSWFSPGTTVAQYSDNNPLVLTGCYKKPFCLYLTSPSFILQDGTEIELGGDMTKWVPMSGKRVRSIVMGGSDMMIGVTGAPFEEFDFTVALNGNLAVIHCKLSADGGAVIKPVAGICDADYN